MPELPPPTLSHHPAIPPPVKVRLTLFGGGACSYLPDRASVSRGFMVEGGMSPDLYHRFMDAGFRRSGRLLYQPVCPGCRACVPIRVPVDSFRPSKSQRRAARRNADLSVDVGPVELTEEKHALYRRYVEGWHGKAGASEGSLESLRTFLYDSPVETIEFTYRDPPGRLLAVGICDVCESSLSSVYFYFDPADAERGLGTFGALHEIEAARRLRIPYYYLGYWVAGCRSMRYKADYRPCEVLGGDGIWRPMPMVPEAAARLGDCAEGNGVTPAARERPAERHDEIKP